MLSNYITVLKCPLIKNRILAKLICDIKFLLYMLRPVSLTVPVIQHCLSHLGTGNVLKIQSLLHLCSEYFGDEKEGDEKGEDKKNGDSEAGKILK